MTYWAIARGKSLLKDEFGLPLIFKQRWAAAVAFAIQPEEKTKGYKLAKIRLEIIK